MRVRVHGLGTSPGRNEHGPHLLSYSKHKENTTKRTCQPFNSVPANCIYPATQNISDSSVFVQLFLKVTVAFLSMIL